MFLKCLRLIRLNRLVLPAIAGLLTAFPLMAAAEEKHHHNHGDVEEHGEHRDLGAHEHGVAELGLAADGQDLVIEFESPAANLIGFEHMPRTAEQEKALAEALAFLKDGAKIFDIDANAKCTMAKADIKSPFEDGAEEKHGHDHDHDHDHDHADKDHGDADHADKDAHSEFAASYAFKCTSLQSLKSVQVNLFDTFPGIEEIHAVYLGDNLQFGVDLTKKNSLITLPGT